MITKVDYKVTSNTYRASQWLTNLPSVVALDFECASRFTKVQKELMTIRNGGTHGIEHIINSDGLSHPSLAFITHLSIGLSPNEALVLICNCESMRKLIYNFLITTEITQWWFNVIFDFKHILFNTGKLPKNWEDLHMSAKCKKNHADSSKCLTGLKALQGHKYGEWGIADELEFDQSNMFNPLMLKYAAIDGCATYSEGLDQQNKTDFVSIDLDNIFGE